mmetsp:Transcript_20335/g.62876  ORF Transcript_20335/g.62876 Transcript_20335/m.62876 type:complete len:125 (-) Transcript_20335:189-563(-)
MMLLWTVVIAASGVFYVVVAAITTFVLRADATGVTKTVLKTYFPPLVTVFPINAIRDFGVCPGYYRGRRTGFFHLRIVTTACAQDLAVLPSVDAARFCEASVRRYTGVLCGTALQVPQQQPGLV